MHPAARRTGLRRGQGEAARVAGGDGVCHGRVVRGHGRRVSATKRPGGGTRYSDGALTAGNEVRRSRPPFGDGRWCDGRLELITIFDADPVDARPVMVIDFEGSCLPADLRPRAQRAERPLEEIPARAPAQAVPSGGAADAISAVPPGETALAAALAVAQQGRRQGRQSRAGT